MTDICPMTGEPHLWGDWERVVESITLTRGGVFIPGSIPTGDRARMCRVCGRWDIKWTTP